VWRSFLSRPPCGKSPLRPLLEIVLVNGQYK
jgi:hypothetical protein